MNNPQFYRKEYLDFLIFKGSIFKLPLTALTICSVILAKSCCYEKISTDSVYLWLPVLFFTGTGGNPDSYRNPEPYPGLWGK